MLSEVIPPRRDVNYRIYFWREMDEMNQGIPGGEKVIIGDGNMWVKKTEVTRK